MHGLHYIVVRLVKKCPEDKKTVFNCNDQLLICSTYVDFSILFLKQAGSNCFFTILNLRKKGPV